MGACRIKLIISNHFLFKESHSPKLTCALAFLLPPVHPLPSELQEVPQVPCSLALHGAVLSEDPAGAEREGGEFRHLIFPSRLILSRIVTSAFFYKHASGHGYTLGFTSSSLYLQVKNGNSLPLSLVLRSSRRLLVPLLLRTPL